jgi:hypothetical protein
MHAAFFRPGGVHQDLPQALIDDIEAFCDPFLKVCDDLAIQFQYQPKHTMGRRMLRPKVDGEITNVCLSHGTSPMSGSRQSSVGRWRSAIGNRQSAIGGRKLNRPSARATV